MRKISILNCELKQKAREPLLKLLERAAPHNVEELRLVNLKGMENLQRQVTGQIVEELASSSDIKVLQLSGLSLTENLLVSNLCEIIGSSRSLTELNLSFCKMSVGSLALVMESLRQNEDLRTLSLKGISLMSYTASQREIDKTHPEVFPRGLVRSDDKFRIECTR